MNEAVQQYFTGNNSDSLSNHLDMSELDEDDFLLHVEQKSCKNSYQRVATTLEIFVPS